MREFASNINKALFSGLRREAKTGRNSLSLTQMQGMFPREGVVIPAGEVTCPFSDLPSADWPYPQLIYGRGMTLLAFEDALFEVDSDWNLSELTFANLYDSQIFTPPASTAQWHMADLHQFWLLFRPDCTLIRLNQAGMFGDPIYVYGQDEIVMNTGVSFSGRLVIGGFNPSTYWPVDWDAMLQYWSEQFAYPMNPSITLGENFVMWTQIGGGDVLSLFRPNYGISLNEDEPSTTIDTLLMERIRRNEWGFMPMPFSGEVLNIKELGRGLAVYGSNGLAVLMPASVPMPTFGLVDLAAIGLFSREAVAGDRLGHVFLDEGGSLWQLTAEMELQRLGYREYLRDLDNPVITFDRHRREFHISDAEHGFILTRDGMGESWQRTTSLVYRNALYGTFHEDPDETAHEGILVSDVLDFGVRDVKTLTTIEVGITTESPAYVAADYRYSKDADFARSPWILLNPEGFARLQVSALEFRLCLKLSDIEDSTVDYFHIKWQPSGKRTIRGLYDTETVA